MGDSDGDAGVESKRIDRPPRPDIRAVNDQTTSAPAAAPSARRDTLLASIANKTDASKVEARARKAGLRRPEGLVCAYIDR
jgi:hypothetical protein